MMKIFFSFLIVLIPGISCYAQMDDRIYLNPQDVHVYENGICIHIENEWREVSQISVDQQGLYVDLHPGLSIIFNTWECPNCEYQNNKYNSTCQRCGYYNRALDNE